MELLKLIHSLFIITNNYKCISSLLLIEKLSIELNNKGTTSRPLLDIHGSEVCKANGKDFNLSLYLYLDGVKASIYSYIQEKQGI